MSFLFRFSKFIAVQILTEWLSANDVIALDFAVCNKNDSSVIVNWFSEFSSVFSKKILGTDRNARASIGFISWVIKNQLNCENVAFIVDFKMTQNLFFEPLRRFESPIKRLQIGSLSPCAEFQDVVNLVKNLHTIWIQRYTKPTTANLLILNCSNLRHCHLSCDVTDELITELCHKNTLLITLRIVLSDTIGMPAIQSIIIYCRQLTRLEFNGSFMNYKALSIMMMHCKAPLKYFVWPSFSFQDSLTYLGQRLEKLHLQLSKEYYVGPWCPNLTDLDISFSDRNLPLGDMLKGLDKLTSLQFSIYQLRDSDLINIFTSMPKLKCLKFTTIDTLLLERTIEVFSMSLENLRILRLPACELTDKYLIMIVLGHKNLTELDISRNRPLTDKSVVSLSECCKVLKILDASNTNIGDRSLIALGNNCKHLITLNVSDCRAISKVGASHVLTWLSLTSFVIKRCAQEVQNVVKNKN